MNRLFISVIVVFATVHNSFGYYNPEQGRWLSRDPSEEIGGENLYAMVENCPISKADFLGLFEIYTHSKGWGHVGIADDEGSTYDYGRYRGTYSGKGGLHAGPNILKRGASSFSEKVFHFNVCPELDKKIRETLAEKLESGTSIWPSEVLTKFKTAPSPLSDSERYMGSDWTTTDNCMTFTFSAVVGAVKKVADDPKATKQEKQQAKVLITMAWKAVWMPTPDSVTAMLDSYASKYEWITTGGKTDEKKDDSCCRDSSSK